MEFTKLVWSMELTMEFTKLVCIHFSDWPQPQPQPQATPSGCFRLYCWLLSFRAVTTSSKVTSESFSAESLKSSSKTLRG